MLQLQQNTPLRLKLLKLTLNWLHSLKNAAWAQLQKRTWQQPRKKAWQQACL
ncbi:hypothetical protein D3C79_1004420 [compost metagenome]